MIEVKYLVALCSKVMKEPTRNKKLKIQQNGKYEQSLFLDYWRNHRHPFFYLEKLLSTIIWRIDYQKTLSLKHVNIITITQLNNYT